MHSALTWVAGPRTPRKVYLTRVWNFGTWQEWQHMRRTYPLPVIEDAVRHPLPGQWTRRGKAFAETLLGCPMPESALLSFDA